ncbi:hypothetical protein BH23PAT2_BH23PAT2_01560 [soil metagenome]
MSRILHELLEVKNHQLDSSLYRLESATGGTGRDVQLTAEIVGRSHIALKSLGLDPHDTTTKEIYYSLESLVKLHNSFLARNLGLNEASTNQEIIDSVYHTIRKLNTPRSVWVIKHAVIKKLLRKKPPKRTLKTLGYRSIDSMLKREPVAHILAVAYCMESDLWQSQYRKQYRDLSSLDFEQRDIEVCLPLSRQWDEVGSRLSRKLQTNVVAVRELGAVILLPMPNTPISGLCLSLLALILTNMEELRMYSSFFKLHQMHASFGDKICASLQDEHSLHVATAGQPFHWRVIHAYFGIVPKSEHPEFFEPHISIEDLAWRKAEDVLLRIEPALDYWKNNDYVGIVRGDDVRPVSFNLLDVVLSYANQMSFENRIVYNMQSALWDELLVRYMSSNHIRSRVLAQLDHGNIGTHEIMDAMNFTVGYQ